MTRTAEKLAQGDYDVAPPTERRRRARRARARDDPHGGRGQVADRRAHRSSATCCPSCSAASSRACVVVDRERYGRARQRCREAAGRRRRAAAAPLQPLIERALGGEQADEELELVGRDGPRERAPARRSGRDRRALRRHAAARARERAARVPVERGARAAHAGDLDLRLRRDPARRRRRRRDLEGVPDHDPSQRAADRGPGLRPARARQPRRPRHRSSASAWP